MSIDITNFPITIPIYEGVDLMDVAAPCEFFGWWAGNTTNPNITITLVAETLEPVNTRNRIMLTPMQTFDDYYQNNIQSGLIWAPGGDPNSLSKLMQGGPYLDFLVQQSEKAEWVTSVCEGALLLAAAGLLNGYTATTHWQFIPCLAEFSEVTVAPGYPRYWVDGNRVTGGGISSGLDESLEIINMIAGEAMAQSVQLYTQYYPDPPVTSTIPGATTCQVDMSGVNMG
ncbi:MAG TPA: DJ-1/PfpI family protein [Pyrinomonadaceae bacterium]|jgi:cyclohexyl-isocyanide hydratase|nr:DJ-1/PfpI family protein [Pyrinomonadaceae bacterium]